MQLNSKPLTEADLDDETKTLAIEVTELDWASFQPTEPGMVQTIEVRPSEVKHLSLDNWRPTLSGAIMGKVLNSPKRKDGTVIHTTVVLQVRRMGVGKHPVAFTESGSAYWLLDPAPGYSLDKAEEWVMRMGRDQERVRPMPQWQLSQGKHNEFAALGSM